MRPIRLDTLENVSMTLHIAIPQKAREKTTTIEEATRDNISTAVAVVAAEEEEGATGLMTSGEEVTPEIGITSTTETEKGLIEEIEESAGETTTSRGIRWSPQWTSSEETFPQRNDPSSVRIAILERDIRCNHVHRSNYSPRFHLTPSPLAPKTA